MRRNRLGNAESAAEEPKNLMMSASALTSQELDELQPPLLQTLVRRQMGRAESDSDETVLFAPHRDWTDWAQSMW